MNDEAETVLVRSSFPVTGQPIRVVMIDGEPWFATADVCRILGRTNPTQAGRIVGVGNHRTVNSLKICLIRNEAKHVFAGQKP